MLIGMYVHTLRMSTGYVLIIGIYPKKVVHNHPDRKVTVKQYIFHIDSHRVRVHAFHDPNHRDSETLDLSTQPISSSFS